MKILFVSPEAAPFIKTGGLGDVAGSLPQTLCEKGVDCRVILPLYRCISQEYREQMKYINHIYIDMAWRKQYCGVFEMKHENCTYYFVDNEYYFGGDKPYDYIHLDCEKFLFFSKAAISLLPTLNFRPDIVHCNDWQTAAIPIFLDTFWDNPFYHGIKTVMTVHNLQFQGRWGLKEIKDIMGISKTYFTKDKLEYYKDANILKGGLVYANQITTVSKTYAQEIKTPAYGEGLDGILRGRAADLTGIVNGISYEEWDPSKDPVLPERYNQRNVIANKKLNKTNLQKLLNIPVDEETFMIGIVSRLTDQKGFDLMASVMERLCESNMQLVVLGTGAESYENLFRQTAWKYPHKVSANIYFSSERSHLIYAACDAFLMPSRFEPCGLSQLISMRYGTLPIVRETGGLKDTVVPYNEFTGEGTGFSFSQYNAEDMLHVIYYAMDIYYNKRTQWNKIVKNAMKADFSWNASADQYIDMYRRVSGIVETAVTVELNEGKAQEEAVALAELEVKTTAKEETPVKKIEQKETLVIKAEQKKEQIEMTEPAEKTVQKKEQIKKPVPKEIPVKKPESKKKQVKRTAGKEIEGGIVGAKKELVKTTAQKEIPVKTTAQKNESGKTPKKQTPEAVAEAEAKPVKKNISKKTEK